MSLNSLSSEWRELKLISAVHQTPGINKCVVTTEFCIATLHTAYCCNELLKRIIAQHWLYYLILNE